MGKTIKGKDKTARKIAAMKRKIDRKTKRGAATIGECLVICGAILAAILSACALCGCATTGPQPARSQNQQNKFSDCNFNFNFGAAKSAAAGEVVPWEMWTLTQANEGSETVSPSATPTTDVKPDIDVSVPVNRAGAAQSVGSVLGDAAAAAVNGLINKCANANAAECTGGNCNDATSTASECADGNCKDK